MGHTLHQIKIDTKTFYIFSKLSSLLNDVTVTLTDGKYSYTGGATEEELVGMASEIEMDVKKFYSLLKESFEGSSSEIHKNRYAYQLQESIDDTYKFSWKQAVEGDMLVQLGSLTMQKSEDQSKSILDVFAKLSTQLLSLQDEVSKLKKVADRAETSKLEMAQRLEEYAAAKESLEKDLYKKFSLVLNEKKARIRELKSKLDAGPQVVPERKSSNSDTDELTNSDNDSITEEEKKTQELEPGPSATSSSNIILDDAISDDDGKPRKSRKRLRAKKPITPVVPRTTSMPRPEEIAKSERESARKRRKSRDVSAEELINDL